MALGLPRWLVALKIVGPQALRIMIPAAGTQFVSMIKDSSLVSIMGLWELHYPFRYAVNGIWQFKRLAYRSNPLPHGARNAALSS